MMKQISKKTLFKGIQEISKFLVLEIFAGIYL